MEKEKKGPNVFSVLKPYAWLTTGLILLGFASNALNLVLPKVIAKGVDGYTNNSLDLNLIIWQFTLLAFGTFLFAYIQSTAQTYAAEKVAKDMRRDLISKISHQSYSYIQEVTSGKLLTNLTSDVDHIKTFISQAVVIIISSLFLVIGGAVLMFMINWKLALAVMCIVPLIGIIFSIVFSKLMPIFKKIQGVTDQLNRIINESVLGAALVRVLNSSNDEYKKFENKNTDAKNLGIESLKLFAIIFPVIGFIANLATLIILALGGYFVVEGTMTIGNFTAFVSYLGIIIFPIIMIGFMSSYIGQAQTSYARIHDTLHANEKVDKGTIDVTLRGDVEVKDLTLTFGEKSVLKNVSLQIKAGSKNAIIGPTAAGKTHLLYLLIGILDPTSGKIEYDGKDINEYKKESLHQDVGIVFQDSSIFNLSLRENIAFSKTVSDEDLKKAIETAELNDLLSSLPQRLDTIVSERGSNLSGGQKQRVMLARALALNPKVLLLDDFTARVDEATERKILSNISDNYPDLTLISVTQKVASVEHYDQIVLIMEGEVLDKGTHIELMHRSPEYVQIFESQQSTTIYEVSS
jgi:ATP-binding cassette, subfamily B, bacterial